MIIDLPTLFDFLLVLLTRCHMGLGGRRDVLPRGDVSVIRGMWEVRVKQHRQRLKEEQERMEQSALPK